MNKFKNKYWKEIFDVDDNTTKNDLKIQYARLIKEYTPSKFPEEFQSIRRAYEVALQELDSNSKVFYEKQGNDFENQSNKVSVEDNRNVINNINFGNNKQEENKDLQPNIIDLPEYQVKQDNSAKVREKLRLDVISELIYRLVFDMYANGVVFEKSEIYEYFINSKDLGLELLNFYYILSPMTTENDLETFFDECNYRSVVEEWKMLLSSYSTGNPKVEDSSVYTSKDQLIAEINNVYNRKRFNYLPVSKFKHFKSKHFEVLKKFVNTVDCRYLVYQDSPSTNFEILEMLEASKQSQYFFYMLLAYNFNSKIYARYRNKFCRQLKKLNDEFFNKLRDVDSINVTRIKSLEDQVMFNYKYMQQKTPRQGNVLYKRLYNVVENESPSVMETRRKFSGTVPIALAVIIYAVRAFYRMDLVLDDDNERNYINNREVVDIQTRADVQKSISEINETIPDISKDINFRMCMEIITQPFDFFVKDYTVSEDGVASLSLKVSGDRSSFNVNNLYVGDVVVGDVTVQEEGEATIINFSYNDIGQDIIYYINGEVAIRCI